MGCKTQSEWETIGMIQCGIRVTSNAAYHHKTKVVILLTKYNKLCDIYILYSQKSWRGIKIGDLVVGFNTTKIILSNTLIF